MNRGRCLESSPLPSRATASSDVSPESTSMVVVPCLLTPSLQGEVNVPMAENWCCAQAKVVELLYTRTINHTKCSTFSVRSNSDLKGSLKVNANRLDVDNKNNLPLYLLLVSREDSEFFFKLDSSSNVSREEAKITNSHGAFHFLPEKNSSFEKLIGTCIVLDKASELLPDDKLTIYFEVNVLENANLSEPSSVVRFKVPECRLSNDHRNLSEGHPLSERQSTMFEYETEEKRLVSSNKSEFHAMLKCSILNANREEIEIVESHEAFLFIPENDWGFEKFLPMTTLLDKTNGLLPEDKLTIYCEVRFFASSTNIFGNFSQVKIAGWRFSEDFGNHCESRQLRGVIVSANGQHFQAAHKVILSVTPPVLAVMFENEMKAKQSQVEIADMNHEALHEMLIVYTGQARNLDSMMGDLLVAADKYTLERLKITREQDLRLRLSAETTAEVLVLADAHDADPLNVPCY